MWLWCVFSRLWTEAGVSGDHGSHAPGHVEAEWCSPTESAIDRLLKTEENTAWARESITSPATNRPVRITEVSRSLQNLSRSAISYCPVGDSSSQLQEKVFGRNNVKSTTIPITLIFMAMWSSGFQNTLECRYGIDVNSFAEHEAAVNSECLHLRYIVHCFTCANIYMHTFGRHICIHSFSRHVYQKQFTREDKRRTSNDMTSLRVFLQAYSGGNVSYGWFVKNTQVTVTLHMLELTGPIYHINNWYRIMWIN